MNTLVESNLKTPIEVLLKVDDEGRTTARNLYDFLELDKSNYSRWVKVNITDNPFAEENTDYWVFVIKDENPKGGRPTIDFMLTASFAKKLAMGCQNEKGEQARDYFIKVEDKLKETVKAKTLEFEKVEAQKARAQAMLLNAQNRTFKTIMLSIKNKNLAPVAVQVFGLKGLESVFGADVGNYLPKTDKTYSATEIGNMLGGISSQRIGTIAKSNNLKTDEYGIWVLDKSRYSNKEVNSFRYNEKAIDKFKEILEYDE